MEVTALLDTRYRRLSLTQLEGLQRAQVKVAQSASWSDVVLATCGKMILAGPRSGQLCEKRAGHGTDHVGYGRCSGHGGSGLSGRVEAAWVMAHKFAMELDCTPWEGLLKAVRIAAGKVAYCEWVLSQSLDDRELEGRLMRQESEDGVLILIDPDSGHPISMGDQAYRDRSWWVLKGELWVERLAKYSKLAIDAGVAERLVETQVVNARLVARPLEAALAALQLTHEQEVAARAAMRREVLALASEGATIQGEVVR